MRSPKGADMIWHDEMCARVRNGMLLTLSEVRSNNASQLAAHDAQENHGAEGTRSTAMFQNSLTGKAEGFVKVGLI